MKIIFLYDGPHIVHKTWAESIGAEEIKNKFTLLRYEDLARKSGKMEIKSLVRKVFGIPMGTFIQGLIQTFLLAREIKKMKPDVILCEGRTGFVPGYFYKRLTKNRLILITADPLIYEIQSFSPFWRKKYEAMLSTYDCIISVSKFMYDLLPKNAKERARVVYPFFDSKFFQYEVDHKSNGMIYVGVVNEQKGIDFSIKAFRRVRVKYPNARFYIIGIGPLMEDINAMDIKEVEVLGRVKELKDYYCKSSVYIHLARFDPFPVTVMEAMASGLVPIVSNMTGTKEIVERIEPKLVVGSPEEAAEIIVELFSNLDKIKELSLKCKEMVKEYAKERSIANFKNAINELIGNENES